MRTAAGDGVGPQSPTTCLVRTDPEPPSLTNAGGSWPCPGRRAEAQSLAESGTPPGAGTQKDLSAGVPLATGQHGWALSTGTPNVSHRTIPVLRRDPTPGGRQAQELCGGRAICSGILARGRGRLALACVTCRMESQLNLLRKKLHVLKTHMPPVGGGLSSGRAQKDS